MNQFYIRVWGDLACFTRPELKVERVSYPVITPSAARGLLEAILYKPEFRWRISRIAVRKPIAFISLRRNELKSKAAANPRCPPPLDIEEDRTQRNTLALRNVEYILEAQIMDRVSTGTGSTGLTKYVAMAQRRIEKGQCFHQPSLGCREFPAFFEPSEPKSMLVGTLINPDTDLGWMLYDVFDLDQSSSGQSCDPKMTLFRARLANGVLHVPTWGEVRNQLEVSA